MVVRNQGPHVEVVVQDDGPGFPPEKADRIFERFYQVDMGGTRRYGGTGIGLALAKEIVELHGGSIRAESANGARFTVLLRRDKDHFKAEVLERRGPARDVPEGHRANDRGLMDFAVQMAARDEYRLLDIAEATERRVSVRDSDEDQKPHLALVVDDTPDIIRLVHNSLRAHFKVISAEDGLKGLEMAVRERPSLVIADLMMPGIDGLELTRRLRGSDETRHIPILMLTAKGDLDDRVAGLETGVSAYLAKPFSPRELLTTARALVQQQETTADIVLTQRMDSLEIVAGGLAHEINNPLNYLKNALARVRMDADLLLAGKLGPEELPRVEKRMRELFDLAESGIRRIAGTVELMSSYSKAGYSRQVRAHDVFGAIREAVSMVLPATGRAVRVDLELPGDGTVGVRPRGVQPGALEPGAERDRGVSGGGRARARARVPGRGDAGAFGEGQRARRPPRGRAPHLHALLHHQGPRPRDGHGPDHRLASGAEPGRHAGGAARDGRRVHPAGAAQAAAAARGLIVSRPGRGVIRRRNACCWRGSSRGRDSSPCETLR